MSKIWTKQSHDPHRYWRRHTVKWWCIKVICGAALISALFIKYLYGLESSWNFPAYLAQGLALLGFVIVLTHYAILKQHNDNIEAPSVLVKDQGLFRWLRHPMYSADILWYTGAFMLFANPLTALILALAIFALVSQAKAEDAFLAERFSDGFAEWQQRTKMLVPVVF